MTAECLKFGLNERHQLKKSSFFEGSREFLRRIWRTRDSDRGIDLGSRFRVPDSERVLVREAITRMFPKWIDGFLRMGDESEEMAVLALGIALRGE